MWTEYFNSIHLINLPERFDRLYDATNLLDEYGIPFKRFEAIRHPEGYMGLIQSMKKLFTECLERGEEKILVFEDDILFCEEKEYFHLVMEKCVGGLKELDWSQFYLGLQHIVPFDCLVRPHILQVKQGYSTHAVAYSKHCMEYFLNNYVAEPVDNFFKNQYHQFGKSFCAYPLLATQKSGISDIGGGEYINWDVYIKYTYNMATKYLLNK